MFCSSCGAALMPGLSYCNRCGANLNPSTSKSKSAESLSRVEKVVVPLAVTTVFVTLFGCALTVALVVLLLKAQVALDSIMILVIASLLMTFGITGMLVRQLSRILTVYLKSGGETPIINTELSERQTPQIEAMREPASSVTEHTTRTFESLPRERQTQ